VANPTPQVLWYVDGSSLLNSIRNPLFRDTTTTFLRLQGTSLLSTSRQRPVGSNFPSDALTLTTLNAADVIPTIPGKRKERDGDELDAVSPMVCPRL